MGALTAEERVVAELAGEPPAAEAAQLPLFPSGRLVDLPAGGIERQQALRAPGRPAGAINRRTKDWRDYLLARYRSPLEGMAETYSRAVGDLAAELGCTLYEAAQLQQRAMEALAPYLHGKMPVEVTVQGTLPLLVLGDPAAYRQASGHDLAPLADFVEIQGDSSDAPA